MILEFPTVGVFREVGRIIVHPVIRNDLGLFIIHIGDAVADKDQIFAVVFHGFIIVKHLFASQQTRMGICTALYLLFNSRFDTIILCSQVEEFAIIRYIRYLIKDYHAHLHGSTCFFNMHL